MDPYLCCLDTHDINIHRTVHTDSHHCQTRTGVGGTTPPLWNHVYVPLQISQEHFMISEALQDLLRYSFWY